MAVQFKKGGFISVSSRPVKFRRAGRDFSHSPQVLEMGKDVDEKQLASLLSETLIVVTEAEDPATEKAPKK